jgi:hypothetical protein
MNTYLLSGFAEPTRNFFDEYAMQKGYSALPTYSETIAYFLECCGDFQNDRLFQQIMPYIYAIEYNTRKNAQHVLENKMACMCSTDHID